MGQLLLVVVLDILAPLGFVAGGLVVVDRLLLGEYRARLRAWRKQQTELQDQVTARLRSDLPIEESVDWVARLEALDHTRPEKPAWAFWAR